MIDHRRFYIKRINDESGVSGTGRVLDGVLWHNGYTTIMWKTDLDPMKKDMWSTSLYSSFEAFKKIHIEPHPTNETEIVWLDELETEDPKPKNKKTKKSTK